MHVRQKQTFQMGSDFTVWTSTGSSELDRIPIRTKPYIFQFQPVNWNALSSIQRPCSMCLAPPKHAAAVQYDRQYDIQYDRQTHVLCLLPWSCRRDTAVSSSTQPMPRLATSMLPVTHRFPVQPDSVTTNTCQGGVHELKGS